jgi:hypothetical protein
MFNLKALTTMLKGLLWINEIHATKGKYAEEIQEGRTGRLEDLWKKGTWKEGNWDAYVSGYQIQLARTAPQTGDYNVDTERFYLRRCGETWYVYHGFESSDGRFPGSYYERPSPYGLVLAFYFHEGRLVEKQVELIFKKDLEVFYSILEKKAEKKAEKEPTLSEAERGGDVYDPL